MATYPLSNTAAQVNLTISCSYDRLINNYVGATGVNATNNFCILAPNRNVAIYVNNGWTTFGHSNLIGFNGVNSDAYFCLFNNRSLVIKDDQATYFCVGNNGLCLGTVSSPKKFSVNSKGVGIGLEAWAYGLQIACNAISQGLIAYNPYSTSSSNQKHHASYIELFGRQRLHEVGHNTAVWSPNTPGNVCGWTGTGYTDPAWNTAPEKDVYAGIYINLNSSPHSSWWTNVHHYGNYFAAIHDAQHHSFRSLTDPSFDKIFINARTEMAGSTFGMWDGEINFNTNIPQFLGCSTFQDIRFVNLRENCIAPFNTQVSQTALRFFNNRYQVYNAIHNWQNNDGESAMWFYTTPAGTGAIGQRDCGRAQVALAMGGDKKAWFQGNLCAFTGCFIDICADVVCPISFCLRSDTTKWNSPFISGPNFQLCTQWVPTQFTQKHHNSIFALSVKQRLHQVSNIGNDTASWSPTTPGNIGGWIGGGITGLGWQTAALEDIVYRLSLNANASPHDKCYHYVHQEGSYSHYFVDANYFHFRAKDGFDKIFINSHSGYTNKYDAEINLNSNFPQFIGCGPGMDLRFINTATDYGNQSSFITWRNNSWTEHSLIKVKQNAQGFSTIEFKATPTGALCCVRYITAFMLDGNGRGEFASGVCAPLVCTSCISGTSSYLCLFNNRTAFHADGAGFHWFTSKSGSAISEPNSLGYGFGNINGCVVDHRFLLTGRLAMSIDTYAFCILNKRFCYNDEYLTNFSIYSGMLCFGTIASPCRFRISSTNISFGGDSNNFLETGLVISLPSVNPVLRLKNTYSVNALNQKHHAPAFVLQSSNRLWEVYPWTVAYAPNACGNIGGYTGIGITDAYWSTAAEEQICYCISLDTNFSPTDRCCTYVHHRGNYKEMFIDSERFKIRGKDGFDKIRINANSCLTGSVSPYVAAAPFGNYDGEVEVFTNYFNVCSCSTNGRFILKNLNLNSCNSIVFRNSVNYEYAGITAYQPSSYGYLDFKVSDYFGLCTTLKISQPLIEACSNLQVWGCTFFCKKITAGCGASFSDQVCFNGGVCMQNLSVACATCSSILCAFSCVSSTCVTATNICSTNTINTAVFNASSSITTNLFVANQVITARNGITSCNAINVCAGNISAHNGNIFACQGDVCGQTIVGNCICATFGCLANLAVTNFTVNNSLFIPNLQTTCIFGNVVCSCCNSSCESFNNNLLVKNNLSGNYLSVNNINATGNQINYFCGSISTCCIRSVNTSAAWGSIYFRNGFPFGAITNYNFCSASALVASSLATYFDFGANINYAYKIQLIKPVKYPFSFQSSVVPTGVTFIAAGDQVLPFSCEESCGLQGVFFGLPSFYGSMSNPVVNYCSAVPSGVYYCTFPTNAILLNCGGREYAPGKWINEKFCVGCYYSKIFITLLNSKGPITTYSDLICTNHNVDLMYNIHGEVLW